MMTMVPDSNREEVEAALREAITRHCKMGFAYQTSLSIDANIDVNIDNKTRVSMSITSVVSGVEPLDDLEIKLEHDHVNVNPQKSRDSKHESPYVVRFVNESAEERWHAECKVASQNFEGGATCCQPSRYEEQYSVHEEAKDVESHEGYEVFEVVSLDDEPDVDNPSDISEPPTEDCPELKQEIDVRNHQPNEDSTPHTNLLASCTEVKLRKFPGDLVDVEKDQSFDVHLYKNDGRYCCPFCEFTTSHGSALSRHLIVHSKDKLRCEKCSEEFTYSTDLQVHIRTKHKELPCKYCGETFQSRFDLSKHIRDCHRQPSSQKKKIKDKPGQRSQIAAKPVKAGRYVNGKGVFQCSKCDQKFSRSFTLKKHTKDVHTGLKKPRTVGSKQKTNKTPLQQGKKDPDSRKIPDCPVFKCSGCEFSTLSRGSLEKHLQRRTDTKCELCHMELVCKNQRRTHMQNYHPIDSKKKSCEFCFKEFHSRQGLYTHRKVMHLGDAFTCHICGKAFPVHSYLTRHLKTHDNSEPYKCPKCLRTFKYHRNFKSHKDGCLNTSGFPCHICGKILKSEYTLTVHIRGMHSEKKWDCQFCGAEFSYVHSRNRHHRQCSVASVNAESLSTYQVVKM